jgi:hypothetical protein
MQAHVKQKMMKDYLAKTNKKDKDKSSGGATGAAGTADAKKDGDKAASSDSKSAGGKK